MAYFPSIFEDSKQKEFFDLLRAKTLVELEEIIEGVDYSEKIKELNDSLLTFADPEEFGGKNGVEIRFDKQFTDMCILLSHKLGLDHSKLTVKEFYNAFEYLKTQEKNDKKTRRNGK